VAGDARPCLLFFTGPAQAQSFPQFTGLVVDAANVLPPQTEADLTAKLQALQRDTKRQLVVATIPNTGDYPLEDYGYRLGRAWGAGLKGVNNGAILFVAPGNPKGQRGPRLEVGYGLEPILTDAFASLVINRDMMPRLRGEDIPGAMTAGTDAVIAQLRASPEEAQARLDAAIREFDRTHARPAGQGNGRSSGGFPMIFWLLIFIFVILPLLRGRRRGRRYSGGGGSFPIILWGSGLGGGGGGFGGGGGWSGGGGLAAAVAAAVAAAGVVAASAAAAAARSAVVGPPAHGSFHRTGSGAGLGGGCGGGSAQQRRDRDGGRRALGCLP
jgi:uncharacterized protein